MELQILHTTWDKMSFVSTEKNKIQCGNLKSQGTNHKV
jgi:hypothetical protein